MNRRRIILAALIGGVIVAAAVYFFATREPSYAGKKLSEWVVMLGTSQYERITNNLLTNVAVTAIQEIGPDAIPFLLKWIRYEPPDNRIRDWIDQKAHDWLNIDLSQEGFPWEANRAAGAMTAFGILGPNARSAIPELLKLINGPPTRQSDIALQTLANLGPDSVPHLLNILRNKKPKHLIPGAAFLIGWVGTNNPEAIPILIPYLKSGDPPLVRHTVRSLSKLHADPGAVISVLVSEMERTNDSLRIILFKELATFGTNSVAAIPGLVTALKDQNMMVRVAATNALRNITPDAAYK